MGTPSPPEKESPFQKIAPANEVFLKVKYNWKNFLNAVILLWQKKFKKPLV